MHRFVSNIQADCHSYLRVETGRYLEFFHEGQPRLKYRLAA